MYIATDGNGVHFLSHKDRKVVPAFSMMNDEVHNSIYSLLVDDRGAVWVGHFKPDWIIHCIKTDCSGTYAYPPQFNSANLSIRSFKPGTGESDCSRDGLFYINEATGIVKSFVKPVLRPI